MGRRHRRAGAGPAPGGARHPAAGRRGRHAERRGRAPECRHLHRAARRRRRGGQPAGAVACGDRRLGDGRVQGRGRVARPVPPAGKPGAACRPAVQAARLRPAAACAQGGAPAVGARDTCRAGPGAARGHPARGGAPGHAVAERQVRPPGRHPAHDGPLQAVCRGRGPPHLRPVAARRGAAGHPGDAGVPELRGRQLRPAGPAGDLLRAERRPAGQHRAAGGHLAAGLPGGAARPAAAAQPQVGRALRQPRRADLGRDRGDAAADGAVRARGVLRHLAARRRAGGGVQTGPGLQRLGGCRLGARHPGGRAAGEPPVGGGGGAGPVRARVCRRSRCLPPPRCCSGRAATPMPPGACRST